MERGFPKRIKSCKFYLMNFGDLLDWICGKKPEQELQEVKAERERRQFFRIDLSDGEVFLDERGPFSIVNLSYGGMRINLSDDEFLKNVKPGDEFSGKIRFENVHFSADIIVRSIMKNDLGCAFQNLPTTFSRILGDFLKPRILGASLQEINSSSLKNHDENLRLRWFQGEDGTQIFLWQALDGEVVKEEFYFLDYIISMDLKKDNFQVGSTHQEGSLKAGFGRIDTNSIAFFKVPSFRALKMGRAILESAAVPMEARAKLLASIVKEERRLYNRYILGESDRQIHFALKDSPDTPLRIFNLSLQGIAFMAPDMDAQRKQFAEGTKIEGKVVLPEAELDAKVAFVYIHNHIMGGNLTLCNKSDEESLAMFLAPRLLGQSLEEVPPPSEMKPFAPSESRAYLFIGFHNTHLLSLVAQKNRLVFGRICFMDFALVYERDKLTTYSCPRGIIFPSDWDLPLELVEKQAENSVSHIEACQQMLESGNIPAEVVASWKSVLG